MPLAYPPLLPSPEGFYVTLHEPDARVQHVPEAVLQDLWRRLAFDWRDLTTTVGQPVQILDPGALNRDGGPDFAAAHIRLGSMEWHGDVEVHRTSGEWLWHRHHEDPAYDRVILHVTLAHDRHTGQLRRRDGSPLPEIVLLPRLTESLRSLLYHFFAHPPDAFACASVWGSVPDATRRPWLRLLGQERLRNRAEALRQEGEATSLDEVLYRALLRALGHAPNADAMEALALRVPLHGLRDLSGYEEVEALLLGAAGLIPPVADIPSGDAATRRYTSDLAARFNRLQAEYALAPLPNTLWQAARLRPANAPARRIAQAAAFAAPGGLLHTDPLGRLQQALQAARPLPALLELLRVEPDPYWRTHLRPEVRCRESSARVGKSRAQNLLVDAVLPTLLLAADTEGDSALAERAAALAMALSPPSDRITRQYEAVGQPPADALEAQGLHQLYRTRCTAGRCLSCTVGKWLIGR